MQNSANWICNGLGGQSMFLLHLAVTGAIPASVTVTADTDSERDRVCSNGERMTAAQFFERFVRPYAEAHGIEALFVRSRNRAGDFLPGPMETLRSCAARKNPDLESMIKGMNVPMFTCDKTRGRLRQSCTDKIKIRAINQLARGRGITLLRNAIGYHAGEAHRIKARYLGDEDGFAIYKPQTVRHGVARDVGWLEHYYPCIDRQVNREQIRAQLQLAGIPYLVTTECDCCPHQDYARWIMHTPEVLAEMAELEREFKGKLFFTNRRVPLFEALEQMRVAKLKKSEQGELTFGCENGAYCGL